MKTGKVYDYESIEIEIAGRKVVVPWGPSVEILDDSRAYLGRTRPMRYGYVSRAALVIASHGVWA